MFRGERKLLSFDRFCFPAKYASQQLSGWQEKESFKMNTKTNIKKLAMAAMLTAVAVVGSMFSFPFLGAKCSPVQHLVNIIGGVYLGP